MSIPPFLEAIQNQILICDGAVGTQLRERIPPYFQCINACNIHQDYFRIVYNIHQEYRTAGADIIQTNTFGANATKLKNYGFELHVAEINRIGAVLAREVAGDDLYVAGSIGPLQTDEVGADLTSKQMRNIFETQINALVDGDVDFLILETFSGLRQTEAAIKQAVTYGLPVVVQLGGITRGKLGNGVDVRVIAREIEKLGAHVVGLNCRGPHDLYEAMKLLAPVIEAPISIQPNAGSPRIEQGKLEMTYSVDAEIFDEYVQKLVKLGASIIGGCCGTTPEYISKIKTSVKNLSPIKRETRIFVLPEVGVKRKHRPGDNPIQQVFETRKNIVSVEMRAATFVQFRAMLKAANTLSAAGTDLFDVTDNSGATINIGAIGTAHELQKETQTPTLIHWTTRSRNLISMQSHLLEAQMLGIRGILVLSGDHPRVGPYEEANLVSDVRGSIQLMQLISKLNRGELFDGSSIGEACNFYFGGGFTIAENLGPHVKHLAKKVKSGAKFTYTQPVYTLADIERTYEATKGLGIKILYGVMPITSFRSASFARDNLGMYIPPFIINQFRDVGDTAGKMLGIRLTLDLVKQIRTQNSFPVHGLYIVPPAAMNWKNRQRVVSEIICEYRRNHDDYRTFN